MELRIEYVPGHILLVEKEPGGEWQPMGIGFSDPKNPDLSSGLIHLFELQFNNEAKGLNTAIVEASVLLIGSQEEAAKSGKTIVLKGMVAEEDIWYCYKTDGSPVHDQFTVQTVRKLAATHRGVSWQLEEAL